MSASATAPRVRPTTLVLALDPASSSSSTNEIVDSSNAYSDLSTIPSTARSEQRSQHQLRLTHRSSSSSSSSTAQYLIRIRHATQLVIVSSDVKHNVKPYKVGKDMDQVEVIVDGGMIVGHDGLIVAVGTDADIARQYDTDANASYAQDIDASGCCILPGFVDGHTHPVWAGDRSHEFKQKLAGATYMDVHKSGGGIGFTVTHTKNASEATLLASFLGRLDRALSHGTTTLEAKSGYGLELATELKMLKVIESANRAHPIDIVGNFCGAHSVPKDSTAAAATHDVIHVQLPAIIAAKKSLNLASLEMIDVFCEKGVFSVSDSKAILQAGLESGLAVNFHGDELNPHMCAAEMGAQLGATAISHLEHISSAGIAAMAARGVVATVLPTTAYVLRIPPPPVRAMIVGNVPIALGTDFNPNAHSISMPFVMNLACVTFGMTMNESLNAATINAAGSLNKAHQCGSLAKGKLADFVMLQADSWEHIIYEMIDPPIIATYKKGVCVYEARNGVIR